MYVKRRAGTKDNRENVYDAPPQINKYLEIEFNVLSKTLLRETRFYVQIEPKDYEELAAGMIFRDREAAIRAFGKALAPHPEPEPEPEPETRPPE